MPNHAGPPEQRLLCPTPHDPAAELALVRAVLQGSESATLCFNECLHRVPRILAAKNARLPRPLSPEDLADVAQDVAVLVLRKLPTYTGHAPLAGWIYRMCCLELRNASRRRARHAVRFTPAASAPDPVAADDEGDVQRSDLVAAIERVGGVEADVLVLKHFEGLTFEEIGRRLEVSPNTAKTRYYRGLSHLERVVRSGAEVEENDDERT